MPQAFSAYHTPAAIYSGFQHYVFTQHRKLLLFTVAAMIILFLLYKEIYPFPDFYFDSFHYLRMAGDSDFISVWPLGYPLFLRAVHSISPSPYWLVAVQYGVLQLSSLWLVFTLFFLFQPPRWVRIAVIAFLSVNPLFLYLANLVSSDILFTALSICWLTLLIHMLARPRYWQLLLQGPLLVYLFMVRYQAAYYPLVMLVALCTMNVSWLWKGISAAIAFLLMAWFIQSTRMNNLRRFGSDRFSPQSSWMLANNALYMYPYIHIDSLRFASPRLRELNREAIVYMESQPGRQPWHPADGARYMLVGGPMWNSLVLEIKRNLGQEVFWYYNRMGENWEAYGKQLIRDHPVAYVRYYLLPNVGVYLWPALEQFRSYANGASTISTNAAAWFRLESKQIGAWWVKGARYLLSWYRPLFLLINAGWLWMVGVLLYKKRYRYLPVIQQKVLLVALFSFAGNAGLLILAGPIVLRYQVYALVLGLVVLLLLIPFLINCICQKQ